MTSEQQFDSAECICGGRLTLLGPVTDTGRWLREELRPRCDGRCISATGPQCNCRCGGENHGQGLAATVVVRRDGGAVVLRPVDTEEARRRAEEYRVAKQAVHAALEARYGGAWVDYRQGLYIPSKALWWELRTWAQDFAEAKRLLTHRLRIRRLQQLAERIRANAAVRI